MKLTKLAFLATTALIGGLISANGAYAQSTATNELDAVVVTAKTGPKTIDGTMVAEKAPKSKYTVTNEFLNHQADGQSVLQSLNLVPGLMFENSDPYGSSGGSIRLHGQDGAHIGFLVDGVPLNDGGNYAIYSNQQVDAELIEQANVNTGSTDADTVTASSTAGVINYTTLKATKDAGVVMKAGLGTDNYRRVFGLIQSGAFGPLGTRAWISGSYQKYDKYKGEGTLEKKQVNARIEQDLAKPGDFLALNFNYNENRNSSYYAPYLATSTASIAADVDRYGQDVDYNTVWTTPAAVNGTADTVPTGNSSTLLGYYGVRLNPSNTGTIRGQSLFTLLPNLKLTVDPSFNYTLANGGGTTNLSETAIQLLGASGATGVDLNGDGDTKDTVQVYSPSNTNTRRYALNTSLIWDVTDTQHVRLAYAHDEAHTRQTGEYSVLNSDGTPVNVFSGKDGYGTAILNAAGDVAQKRNRTSVATLDQFSVEYRGEFMDDRLTTDLGVRLPNLDRELHQYCYSKAGSTTYYCTAVTPTSTSALAAGAVAQAVVINGSTYFTPFNAKRSYDAVLPNIGVSYRFTDTGTVYASYAEQMSAPKVDNLYTLNSTGGLGSAEPETGKTFEAGYRFRTPTVMASISAYDTKIKNRIVTTVDPTDNTYIDRNVGAVEIKGVDGQAQWRLDDSLTAYVSASYTDAQLQNDLFVSTSAGYAKTAGKQVVETPKWTFAGRLTYDFGKFQLGVQGKFVGDRYITDVNDVKVPHYTVWDTDLRYDLGGDGWKKSYIQLNVTNMFNEKYYGNLSGTTTSGTPGAAGYGQPYAYLGAPRAAIISLKTAF